MGMPAVEHRRWTAAEVRALIDANPLQTPRYELVDGELLVTPSPGMHHQSVVGGLLVALIGYLDRERVGKAFTSPSDVELAPELLVQPDVYVLPIREWRRILSEGNPARELMLAIEVLSPSSSRHDRVRKRPHYQRTVPEYWIVDVDARLVERWRPGDARPEIVTDTLTWHADGAAAPFSLPLSPLFAEAFGEAG
jgi:Uma2 family endonuclease